MGNYSFSEYQNLVATSSNKASSNIKVGFFKLANDMDEALVRFNIASLDDLKFATIHTVNAGGKWIKVSCKNPFGNVFDKCALCAAAELGNSSISKASKRVFIQAICSYKDSTTGSWSAPVPVIWERPAGFSKELAGKLKDYGSLKDIVLKVTRNGMAGDMKTTYSLDFIPMLNKPELVPNDFAAFNNFDLAKHSYWEKTEDEINTFLNTGAFPEVIKADFKSEPVQSAPVQTPVAQVAPQATAVANQATASAVQAPTPETMYKAADTVQTPVEPTQPQAVVRNFNGFSF